MTDLEVTLSGVTLPTNTSGTVYIYEDVDDNGGANSVTVGSTTINYDNVGSVALSNGQTSYTISGFDASSGNRIWPRFQIDNTDDVSTAELVEATSVEPATVSLSRTSELYGTGEITDTQIQRFNRTSELYGTGEITGLQKSLLSTRTSNIYGVGQTIGSRDVKRQVSIMTAQEQWDNYGISFYEGTNTYKLVTALLGYERNTNFTRLEKNHYVSESTANALDRIGQLVQCYRKEGESDEKYAARIKAFGVASRSDGTFRDVIDLVKIVLQIPYEDIEITYSGAQATITIPVNALNNTELTDTEFVNVVEKSVFAGHRIVINQAGSDPFTLKTAGTADDASLGLSSDTVEGGGLVEQI